MTIPCTVTRLTWWSSHVPHTLERISGSACLVILLRAFERQSAYDGGRRQRWIYCFDSTPLWHCHIWCFYRIGLVHLEPLWKNNLAWTLLNPLNFRIASGRFLSIQCMLDILKGRQSWTSHQRAKDIVSYTVTALTLFTVLLNTRLFCTV